jgi:hypothetical protein
MLAATFWERLQEAPLMALRIVGMLFLCFLCFGVMGFVGSLIWALLTKILRIPGTVIVASILGSISLFLGWEAVQFLYTGQGSSGYRGQCGPQYSR